MLFSVIFVRIFVLLLCYCSIHRSKCEVPSESKSFLARFGRHLLLILNGKRYTFPDRYTLHRMGYHWGSPNITVLSKDNINKYPVGGTLKSLWDHHSNVKMLSLGQSPYISYVRKTFSFSNPSIVVYRKEFVVSWRVDAHNFRVVWLDKSSGFKYTSRLEDDIQELANFNLENNSIPSITLPGEDPRLFVLSDGKLDLYKSLLVTYATRYPRKTPEIRMSYVELSLNSSKISYGTIFTFNYESIRGKEDQKNWSPFDYNGNTYLISSGLPHRITAAEDPLNLGNSNIVKARTVSETLSQNISEIWKYGEIRGGTPALLINDVYLTFFHSSVIPPIVGDVLRTYVFGAYIFEKDPPFAIKAITELPTIHPSMYSGEWTNLPGSFYLIDYVAFPMSMVLSDDNKFIYLLYGHQDVTGWFAKIDVSKLFASLTTITG